MCFCNKLPRIHGHHATQIYRTVLEVRSPTWGWLGWIPGISRTALVSGVSEGKSVSCLSQFSRGCPRSLFCGPLSSSQSAMTGVLFLSWHHADTDFPHVKGPCDCMGPTWLILDHLFSGQVINNFSSFCSLNSPMSFDIRLSQVLRNHVTGCGHFGGRYSHHHIMFDCQAVMKQLRFQPYWSPPCSVNLFLLFHQDTFAQTRSSRISRVFFHLHSHTWPPSQLPGPHNLNS